LITRLIVAAGLESTVDKSWSDGQVVDLADGQMGSLRFVGSRHTDRLKKESELELVDADGVRVSVALLVDQSGRLAELDVFKADFSAVVALRIPD
jgi:hypothetical protein